MQYMTHPEHGAHHASDRGEVEKLEKAGWVKAKEPTAAEIRALKAGANVAALKAQLAEQEAIVATASDGAPVPDAPKRQYRKKAAA